MSEIEVEVTGLAAGGDGVARDASGRVTFVPRSAPGDIVRVRLTKQTSSFARGDLVRVVRPSALRVSPPCKHFVTGCGGCQWQHVGQEAQLAAKHAIVTSALRNLPGLAVEDVLAPAPPYGWRRRARFHVADGWVGLYAYGSQRVIPIRSCPQLEPALDEALRVIVAASPPDGELAMLRGYKGEIVIGRTQRGWARAAKLVGRAGIVGVVAGNKHHGTTRIEVEPGLWGEPWDFAQASAAGNAALIDVVRTALGSSAELGAKAATETGAKTVAKLGANTAAELRAKLAAKPGATWRVLEVDAGAGATVGTRTGPVGRVLELHAGAGNFTRALVADGWDTIASDVVTPAKPVDGARFEAGTAEEVLARVAGPFDAIVLDPPRTGAPEAMAGIAKHAPRLVVYISCDPATLARDAQKLVDAGYRAERAWPVDLMPQTAHVEVVLRLVR